jgi:hypothetical protein
VGAVREGNKSLSAARCSADSTSAARLDFLAMVTAFKS